MSKGNHDNTRAVIAAFNQRTPITEAAKKQLLDACIEGDAAIVKGIVT